MSASWASTLTLPYQLYQGRAPRDDQQNSEAMTETIIAEFIDTADEAVFDLLRAWIRPDMEHSQVWEHVGRLCYLSGQVSFWENQRGQVEAFETSLDDYKAELTKFATAAVHA